MRPIAEEDVRTLLLEALARLTERDTYLFTHDLHERTFTHKLAEYLQPLFPEWNVDCEYNRDCHDPKRVNLSPQPDPGPDEGSNVFPDIIVHSRGNNDHNLLIVEAKKVTRQHCGIFSHDRRKIEAFSRDLQYRFGAAVRFIIADHEPGMSEFDFFSDGKWA